MTWLRRIRFPLLLVAGAYLVTAKLGDRVGHFFTLNEMRTFIELGYGNGAFSQMSFGRDYSNPANLYVRNTIYGSGYGKTPRVEEIRALRPDLRGHGQAEAGPGGADRRSPLQGRH